MVADEVRNAREEIVRRHMGCRDEHRYADAIGTFEAPALRDDRDRDVYDWPVPRFEEYLRESRTAFPVERNELIALHHADDAVIVEFWLLGTHQGRADGHRADRQNLPLPHDGLLLLPRAPGWSASASYFDSATILRQLGCF